MLLKERTKKDYRISELDESIRSSRTKTEARILYGVAKAGVNAPRLVAVTQFGIYMTEVEGNLLRDIAMKPSYFPGIGRQLALMHNANIVHGDFTPANIISSGGSFYIIDFGLAEFENGEEEKAIDLLLMKRSIDRRCYQKFVAGYSKHAKDAKGVLLRLEEVEKRGRYQSRTLS